MADDLPRAHAAGVHRDDLVVETRETALVLGDQLRIKAGLAVARHLQLDPTGVGDDGLLAIAVAPVAGLLAGQMMIHLGVQHPLGQGLLQIVEQAIRVERGLRIRTRQQLVENGVRNTRLFASWHGRAPSLPSCPAPHEIPDSPPRAAYVRSLFYHAAAHTATTDCVTGRRGISCHDHKQLTMSYRMSLLLSIRYVD